MAKQTALKDLQKQEDDIMKRLDEAKKDIEPGTGSEATIKEIERELEKNQSLQRLITKEEDQIAKAILAGVSTGEFDINDYIEYKSDPDAWLAKQREGAANGGRIGYLGGGQTGLMPELSDADTDEVQDLSYSELRARLPQEISNEVVQVLSSSKKALLDFANIATQQDVDNFNQQYGVSLSLPQEA